MAVVEVARLPCNGLTPMGQGMKRAVSRTRTYSETGQPRSVDGYRRQETLHRRTRIRSGNGQPLPLPSDVIRDKAIDTATERTKSERVKHASQTRSFHFPRYLDMQRRTLARRPGTDEEFAFREEQSSCFETTVPGRSALGQGLRGRPRS
jgi:hypothetical protein